MSTYDIFDFNSVDQPLMPIKLGGGTRQEIVVNLMYPSVDLVEKLSALALDMKEIVEEKNGTTIRATFELIAAVMNCNADGLTFTAEDLRDKYRLTLLGIAKFLERYFDFLKQANDAKN